MCMLTYNWFLGVLRSSIFGFVNLIFLYRCMHVMLCLLRCLQLRCLLIYLFLSFAIVVEPCWCCCSWHVSILTLVSYVLSQFVFFFFASLFSFTIFVFIY